MPLFVFSDEVLKCFLFQQPFTSALKSLPSIILIFVLGLLGILSPQPCSAQLGALLLLLCTDTTELSARTRERYFIVPSGGRGSGRARRLRVSVTWVERHENRRKTHRPGFGPEFVSSCSSPRAPLRRDEFVRDKTSANTFFFGRLTVELFVQLVLIDFRLYIYIQIWYRSWAYMGWSENDQVENVV